MRPHRLLLAIALLGALVLGAAPGASAHGHRAPAPCPKTIVETAVAAGDFSTLVSLVQQAGLADTPAHGGPFTVFAPANEAFAKVQQATLDALGADPALLKKVLLYHVVSGRISAAEAARARVATTLEGAKVFFCSRCHKPFWWFVRRSHQLPVWCNVLRVNNATIVTPVIATSNGVIHAIDTVLMPPAG